MTEVIEHYSFCLFDERFDRYSLTEKVTCNIKGPANLHLEQFYTHATDHYMQADHASMRNALLKIGIIQSVINTI